MLSDVNAITELVTIKGLESRVVDLKRGEGFSAYGVVCLTRFDLDSECESREVVTAVWYYLLTLEDLNEGG